MNGRNRPFQPWSKIKAQIVLHTTDKNHLGEVRDWETVFGSVHDFSNYMRWQPEVGIMIGYKPRHNQILKEVSTLSASLSVRFGSMEMEKQQAFKDIYEFADFLKANTDIANALQAKIK
jgi:hydrogenase maturation factor HypF (carbamoyltransferase family)